MSIAEVRRRGEEFWEGYGIEAAPFWVMPPPSQSGVPPKWYGKVQVSLTFLTNNSSIRIMIIYHFTCNFSESSYLRRRALGWVQSPLLKFIPIGPAYGDYVLRLIAFTRIHVCTDFHDF